MTKSEELGGARSLTSNADESIECGICLGSSCEVGCGDCNQQSLYVRRGRKKITEKSLNLGSISLVGKEELDKFKSENDQEKEKSGYVRISVVVDSGCIDNVFKKEDAAWIPIEETTASRNKSYYTAAGGHKIFNEGQGKLEGITSEGQNMRSKVHIGNLTKSLWSVGETKKADNIVAFG